MTLAVAMPTAAEPVSRALEKFDPHQLRDPGGEDGGRWIKDPASAAISALDKLKLGKRAPDGFTVRSSKKLTTDYSDVGIAEVDGPDGPHFRVGIIGNESGKWDAGFTGEERKARLRKEIAEKQTLLDSKDEPDDDLEEEIGELESELDDLDNERTAVVSPKAAADLRRQLDGALELAKANKVKQDATVKAFDALDAKREAVIAKFSDADLERKISKASGYLRSKLKTIKGLESGPNPPHWTPEYIAELVEMHKAGVPGLEAELAPLLARRAELMPPDARARLEDLDRQYAALNEADIDDMLTSAEVPASGGVRIFAQVWGSDDEDEGWTNTRLYVLAPGETADDADQSDGFGYFRGLKGLNKLIAALDTSHSPESFNRYDLGVHSMPLSRALESFAVMSPSPAVRLMMLARTVEASDTFSRRGHLIHVERGRRGRFAENPVGNVLDAIGDAVTDAPKKRSGRQSAVAKALASGNSLSGFDREPLRLEAKRRGLDVPHGAHIDVIRDMLHDHENVELTGRAPDKMQGIERGWQPGEWAASQGITLDPAFKMGPMSPEQMRKRADKLLSDMPSDQAGRDRVHTEVGRLTLDADRMDAAAKPARTRAKKAPVDTSAVRSYLDEKQSGSEYVDIDEVADRLKGLSHAQLDEIAAERPSTTGVKGTRLNKAKQIAEIRFSAKNSQMAIDRGTRTQAEPARGEEAGSYFSNFKAGFAANVAADRERALAKKAAAVEPNTPEKPKRTRRTTATPGGEGNSAKADRINQITAELRTVTDPDQRSRLKAERRRLQDQGASDPKA